MRTIAASSILFTPSVEDTMPTAHPRRYRRRTDDPDKILREAGPSMGVPSAGVLFGLGENASRSLARRGEFPVRVIRVGRQYRVPTSEVRKALGLPPASPVAEPGQAASA